MKLWRRLCAAFALTGLVALASSAEAARVRIDYVAVSRTGVAGGQAPGQPDLLFGSQELNVTGAASQVTAPTITIPGAAEQVARARVTVLSGAVNIAWGDNPTATEAAGLRISAGQSALVPVRTGQKVSLLEAATASVAAQVTLTNATGVLGAANPLQALTECTVVTGDQAYAAGTIQPCTLTATGRVRVGLSSAASVGATASTTSDLVGAIDQSGLQQALRVDALRNLATTPQVGGAPVSAANPLPALDTGNAAFQGEVPMTVGATYSVGRSLKLTCTVAGAVSVAYADGSTGVWSVTAAIQTLPLAVTSVLASGTTAVCTYSNLK